MITFSWAVEAENLYRIKLKTPTVQAGTFHRLAAAIFLLDFDILAGDLNTVEDDGILYSSDQFLLMSEGTSALPQEKSARLGELMENLLRENRDPVSALQEREIEPPGRRQFFELEPEIVFQDLEDQDLTQFFIETVSRKGLLYYISRILYQLNINILRAEIRTSASGVAEDTFYLQHNNTCLGPELSAAVERAIKERS